MWSIIKVILDRLRLYGPKRFTKYFLFEMKLYMKGLLLNTYSQMGEDLEIDKLVNYKGKGFYIDVGANDSKRFSNTMRFYKRGWYGINIEPDTNKYKQLRKKRPRDINLNIGVSTKPGKLKFFVFSPDTLSTFSPLEARKKLSEGYKVVKELFIDTQQLTQVIQKYCKNIDIDFITVDTEGYDMEVLKSLSWERFRPKLVCVETVNQEKHGNNDNLESIDTYLIKQGYEKSYDNGLNTIYRAL